MLALGARAHRAQRHGHARRCPRRGLRLRSNPHPPRRWRRLWHADRRHSRDSLDLGGRVSAHRGPRQLRATVSLRTAVGLAETSWRRGVACRANAARSFEAKRWRASCRGPRRAETRPRGTKSYECISHPARVQVAGGWAGAWVAGERSVEGIAACDGSVERATIARTGRTLTNALGIRPCRPNSDGR